MEEISDLGKVFLTGGSGHVGANLLHRLLRDGHDVRVLLRAGDRHDAVDAVARSVGGVSRVERVVGDLRDEAALRRAVAGCATAFHVAAKVSTVSGDSVALRELFETNVLGTANLLRAARDAGVRRVVVTGSFSAVGYDVDHPSRPADETMPFQPFDGHMPYGRTKMLVEHECLKAVAQGQDVVIATSCAVLGPWDYVPSRMGKTLIDFANRRLPAYIPGGFEFVNAGDLAEGHLLAMRRGRRGQKYIFSTQFLSVDEIMDLFESVSGVARPRLRLPPPLMAAIAEVSSFVLSNFFPKVSPRFTPGAVQILRMQRHADITRAKTDLGYVPTSIRAAIEEAYVDFARRGLVPPERARDRAGARSGALQGRGSLGSEANGDARDHVNEEGFSA